MTLLDFYKKFLGWRFLLLGGGYFLQDLTKNWIMAGE
jgi:hypothetical protein